MQERVLAMHFIRRSVVVLVLLFVLLTSVDTCRAGSPTYLDIEPRRPEGTAVPTPAQRYAYGWFGVPQRKHEVRHFGYNRNYTQWSFR